MSWCRFVAENAFIPLQLMTKGIRRVPCHRFIRLFSFSNRLQMRNYNYSSLEKVKTSLETPIQILGGGRDERVSSCRVIYYATIKRIINRKVRWVDKLEKKKTKLHRYRCRRH